MGLIELDGWLDQGEGQRLEFKRGVPAVKDLALSVACLANAQGGRILLGVDDKGRILGCSSYNVPDLLSGIYRATDPPITVDIEEVDTSHGTVLVVTIPRTAFVHGTTGGVFQRRVGRECLPMSSADVLAFQSERSALDYSALSLPGARYPDDLDPRALERFRADISVRQATLAEYADLDLLRNLALLTQDESSQQLTVAGALFLARPQVLRHLLPQSEVAYLRLRTDTDIALNERLCLPLPLLLQRLEELIQAANESHSLLVGLQRIDVPAFPVPVYREAILNAIAHRNYGLPGTVVIRHYPDRLEIMSPGGLPIGVTPQNILRQVVARNPRIAETLQRTGYVERAGYGVDMMYRELLRLGKEPPIFASDELSVRVVLRNGGLDEPFVTYVEQRRRAGMSFDMEQLLVLRYLKNHLELDLEQAMRILQRQETETLELLGSMVRQQQLERVGRGRQSLFQLSAEAAASLAVPAFGRFLTPTELENRVLTYAQNHGQITNRDCRRVCGLSADQASRLLARLARTGQLQATGSKRGRAYLPVSG